MGPIVSAFAYRNSITPQSIPGGSPGGAVEFNGGLETDIPSGSFNVGGTNSESIISNVSGRFRAIYIIESGTGQGIPQLFVDDGITDTPVTASAYTKNSGEIVGQADVDLNPGDILRLRNVDNQNLVVDGAATTQLGNLTTTASISLFKLSDLPTP
ncbi:hypothetical protein GCM10008906_04750 [Clostridium oceanicum]|uniref:BclA C-terminal domain-containing protein n=2 Tax=Clostridium oceanicum TaxID=1543 RepID=A0ABN1JAN6_9CLOT